MPTVCRYIVVNVDASFATFASAEENCSQATTMVNPSSAPYTSPTQVKNGDSVELYSLADDLDNVRFASHTLPTPTIVATMRANARNSHKPAIPKSPTAHLRRSSVGHHTSGLPMSMGAQ